MCISCFSRIDAIGVQSIGVLAAVASGVRRVRHLRRGTSRTARRAADWDESATFLRGLGHEPAALLGPRPGEMTPATVVPPEPQAREPMRV